MEIKEILFFRLVWLGPSFSIAESSWGTSHWSPTKGSTRVFSRATSRLPKGSWIRWWPHWLEMNSDQIEQVIQECSQSINLSTIHLMALVESVRRDMGSFLQQCLDSIDSLSQKSWSRAGRAIPGSCLQDK